MSSQLPTVRRERASAPRRGRPTAEAPLVLGRYRLARRLGAGAFATVWMARDERLERDVAVKMLPRERVVGGRFEREARAAARLSHPGIVTLYEAAVDDEGAYLVSELVNGFTLYALLEAGQLSDKGIVQIGMALCDALSHAHEEGVIHRDVKPSNVLIPKARGNPIYPAKLTDFGVAHVLGGDTLTRTGDVIGTEAYMAPEQAEGRTVGVQSDLYSLALVIYEALTGVNPVLTTGAAVRARRLGAHLPPLRRQRRDLPRELGAGVDLALRPRPRERGSLEDLRLALEVSQAFVGDAAGVVAPPWRSAIRAPRDTAHSDAVAGRLEDFEEPASRDPDDRPPEVAFDGSIPRAVPPRARAAAAMGAAACAAWPATLGLLPGGIPVALLAVIGAVLVLAASRAGWIALAVTLTWCAAVHGRPAGAALLLVAMLVPVAMLPRRGSLWPLPSGAVALGLLGLGGAWPAVAARIGASAWRRAAMAACGWLWLMWAAPLAGRELFVSRHGVAMPGSKAWTASLPVAGHHALGWVAGPGVLAGALVWATAAVVLPWLTRYGSAAIEFALVAAWAAMLVICSDIAVTVGGWDGAPRGDQAALGAVAGAVIVLWPTIRRAARVAIQSVGARAQLP